MADLMIAFRYISELNIVVLTRTRTVVGAELESKGSPPLSRPVYQAGAAEIGEAITPVPNAQNAEDTD
jgi:hypothetical protein